MGVGNNKNVGVKKCKNGDGWMFDIRLKNPDGTSIRRRKSGFRTEAQAAAAAGKLKAEALEGRYFDREGSSFLTVSEAWENFRLIAEEKHRSIQTTLGRANHLLRHLGKKNAASLTKKDVVEYRKKRRKEKTVRKKKPSDTTLNREIELLRRILNYSVECKDLQSNPLSKVEMLEENNVRDVDIPEVDINKLVEAAEQPLQTLLLIAHDSGMRKKSILGLRRSRIDFDRERAIIKLSKNETKTNKAQTVVLTRRATLAVKELLEFHGSEWIFFNSNTGKPYVDLRKMYRRALKKAELEDKGYWIHDQRRVFSTKARRAGIDESTIMSLTGHKTRSAFERYNIVATADQEAAIAKYEAAMQSKVVEIDTVKQSISELKQDNCTLREKNEHLRKENDQLKRTLKILLERNEDINGAVANA